MIEAADRRDPLRTRQAFAAAGDLQLGLFALRDVLQGAELVDRPSRIVEEHFAFAMQHADVPVGPDDSVVDRALRSALLGGAPIGLDFFQILRMNEAANKREGCLGAAGLYAMYPEELIRKFGFPGDQVALEAADIRNPLRAGERLPAAIELQVVVDRQAAPPQPRREKAGDQGRQPAAMPELRHVDFPQYPPFCAAKVNQA
ncbi:MAG TPA: hypothetical protein VKV32_06710 [Stellaceae bacterium]|nr:hypothetical protein [Stellaceae bacterium]